MGEAKPGLRVLMGEERSAANEAITGEIDLAAAECVPGTFGYRILTAKRWRGC